MKIQFFSLLSLYFAISLTATPVRADGPPAHRPMMWACQSSDGALSLVVKMEKFDPVTGSVTLHDRSGDGTPYTHAIVAAGHEDDGLQHLYFDFETPKGAATVLIGTQGSPLDGTLLSPYGDQALTCTHD